MFPQKLAHRDAPRSTYQTLTAKSWRSGQSVQAQLEAANHSWKLVCVLHGAKRAESHTKSGQKSHTCDLQEYAVEELAKHSVEMSNRAICEI